MTERAPGFFARWGQTRSLLAASGIRRLPKRGEGVDAEAEKARLARQRQALALATGVSSALWLALAVGIIFVTREG